MEKLLLCILLLILIFSGFSQDSNFTISPPPTELGLDKFYKKYTDASGIPIVALWRVPDEAIVKVAQMTEFYLNKHLKNYDPSVIRNLAGYFPEVEFELSCHCKK
jgi:hypothetical protein